MIFNKPKINSSSQKTNQSFVGLSSVDIVCVYFCNRPTLKSFVQLSANYIYFTDLVSIIYSSHRSHYELNECQLYAVELRAHLLSALLSCVCACACTTQQIFPLSSHTYTSHCLRQESLVSVTFECIHRRTWNENNHPMVSFVHSFKWEKCVYKWGLRANAALTHRLRLRYNNKVIERHRSVIWWQILVDTTPKCKMPNECVDWGWEWGDSNNIANKLIR